MPPQLKTRAEVPTTQVAGLQSLRPPPLDLEPLCGWWSRRAGRSVPGASETGGQPGKENQAQSFWALTVLWKKGLVILAKKIWGQVGASKLFLRS